MVEAIQDIRALSVFTVSDMPQGLKAWALEYQDAIKQALSTGDETKTSVDFNGMPPDQNLPWADRLNIRTEFGEDQDIAVLLITLHLKKVLPDLPLHRWQINYMKQEGIWLGDHTAPRQGYFYSVGILPTGTGLLLEGFPFSATKPVTSLINPFGEIFQISENGIIPVFSPRQLLPSTNGHQS